MHLILQILTILLALAGAGIAWYIYSHKANAKQLVCPVGTKCVDVLHSKYSHLFGISIALLGFLYYATIFILNIVLVLYPEFKMLYLNWAVLIMSAGAFCFSLYLTFIQGTVLKDWCSWCVSSAIISTLIFIISIIKYKALWLTLF